MAEGKDIPINIRTTADISGFQKTEEAQKSLGKTTEEFSKRPPPRIIDANAKDTELIREQTEAFTEWQKARDAARESTTEGLATSVPDFLMDSAKADAFTASMTKMQAAAKAGAEELPALREADVAAEAVARLGKASEKAAGSGGLGSLRQGLRGVLNGASAAGAGRGGLLGVGSALIGVLNPIGLVTAAVSLAAAGWFKWKKSLDDWDEAAKRGSAEMGELGRAAAEAAEKTRSAQEDMERQEEVSRGWDRWILQNTQSANSFTAALGRNLDAMRSLKEYQDEVAGVQLEIDVEAETDPVKKEELRNAARREAQERQLQYDKQTIEKKKEAEKQLNDELMDILAQRKNLEEQIARVGGKEKELDQDATADETAAKERRKNADKVIAGFDEDVANAKEGAMFGIGKDEVYGRTQRAEERRDAAKDNYSGLVGNAENNAASKRAAADAAKAQREKLEEELADKEAEADARRKDLQKITDERQGAEVDLPRKEEIFRRRDTLGAVRIEREKERAQVAVDEKREKAEAAATKERKRIRNEERDLETDITGLGRDAAAATKGLGARGVNPEGFNQLASKIARKGDPQGDKLDLSTFLKKVSMLVDAIPDSKSSSKDAENLREVERKIEQKLDKLTQQIKLNRD